jgi:hypothetical protein
MQHFSFLAAGGHRSELANLDARTAMQRAPQTYTELQAFGPSAQASARLPSIRLGFPAQSCWRYLTKVSP